MYLLIKNSVYMIVYILEHLLPIHVVEGNCIVAALTFNIFLTQFAFCFNTYSFFVEERRGEGGL